VSLIWPSCQSRGGVGEACEPGCEAEPEEVEEGEDDVAVAGGVGAVDLDRELAFVVEDAVEDVGRVADGRADYARGEVGVLVADKGVVGEAAVATEVAREGPGLLAVGGLTSRRLPSLLECFPVPKRCASGIVDW